MTKSTQFKRGFFRWILPRLHAFPVRRYRIDAQCVRVVMRRLEHGRVVCIYPEGERTWDGRLQPLRKGTLRVVLHAGVPVVPIGIEGMYDVWPRWSKRPNRGLTARIRIGEPVEFGQVLDRKAREAALPEVEHRLRKALLELSGEVDRFTGDEDGLDPNETDSIGDRSRTLGAQPGERHSDVPSEVTTSRAEGRLQGRKG